MKRYASFFVIAVMILCLCFMLFTRVRTPHNAPQEELEAKTDVDAGADAAASDAALAANDAASADAGVATAAKPGEKPIRVTSLGWELVAPGVANPADGGAPVELAPETTLDAVQDRLAKGGDNPQGADIAIVPLPAFVASYEKLRALDPKVFLIVGFSHGREEVHANTGALLKAPPGADEVKLVALGSATSADANMQKAGSESATVLGLFALDLLGVAPSRIRMVAAGSEPAKTAPFSAVVRGAADERKVAFSTADASRFMPIVAIAPKSVLDARGKALEDWSRAWVDGLGRAKQDAPNIARRLAAKENIVFAAGVGGAPDALVLVERLGQIEAETRMTTPATLDAVMQRTWQLARGGGLVTAAAPDPLPVDPRIMTVVTPDAEMKRAPQAEGDAGTPTFVPPPAGSTALVVYRAVDSAADANAVAAQIGFLSGVFERAVFRVTAKGGDKAAKAIATAAHDKHAVPISRLATAAGEPQGAFASVEILAPP